jgi:Tfp pilus assembly protein PilX
MSMPRFKASRRQLDEHGFASIVIALVLIVILGLLTVGFAQLARREQQDALSKQLATQAYYAAESGINDAAKDLHTGDINTADSSTTQCMTGPSGPSGTTRSLPSTALSANSNIDSSDGVSYSCLLVNPTPSSLVWDNTPPGAGQYLAFSITNPLVSLANLTIQWGSHDGHNTYPTSGTYGLNSAFPSLATWNTAGYPPVLQFSLVSTNSGGAVSRVGLIGQTFNTYLYPASDHGTYPLNAENSSVVAQDLTNPTKQGQIVSGNCGNVSPHNPYPCSVTISGSGATGLGGTSFLLHFLDFYDASDVYITGTDTAGNPVDFIGQVQVDVTGKAQNVLKRLQVRLNADGTNGTIGNDILRPDYSLQAGNICKRLATEPNSTTFKDPDGTPATAIGDPCDLNQ